jgi:hypothetical protein
MLMSLGSRRRHYEEFYLRVVVWKSADVWEVYIDIIFGILLAYFAYLKKINGGLREHLAISLCIPRQLLLGL